MHTAFISHPDCLLHECGPYHPERPARLPAIEDELVACGLMPKLERHVAPLATHEQLLRVHAADYIEMLEAASLRAASSGAAYLDPDTAMNRHSMNAALRAAGAAVLATDLVIEKKADNAFCNIRPPGHHAGRGRAMGFCFINNVAVGAAHALEAHGLERVAVVDFDVHHGNGTEDIFRDDERVMMVSIFQHPFYPFSGAEGRSERMVNIPLPAGAGGKLFRAAVHEFWLPALDRFQPEMLFVSAGFDAHRDDDLSSLNLVEDDYAWVTETICAAGRRFAGNRIVSVLEGGYDLKALGRSVAAHVQALNTS
ncbi:Acetoin utilization deacetylase AcuC [Nitrosospira sp. Nsp14]|uniref:histone deacetylase family protein n=1 Tax=Nitrosospira sp. Nsp14 TaxID=1855333 RepID=UPI0008EEC7BF|nr:histone deacetylase family protein [Nitrosospira sp. Nsp14]SFH42723.1 Acetoin utilization deacetylase AcuC [Nitrosospira sp. Nsp14]